jgi:hypothetical protein
MSDCEIMQEEPPEPYYNNRIFSDCVLFIKKNSEVTNIHVSKFLLASKSQYFFKLFSNSMKESSENNVNIILEESYDITHFQDIIRLVYEEPLQTPPEENLHLLYLADKYGLDEAVEKIVDLMKNSQRDSLSNAYTFLEIRHHDSLYARESVKRYLVQPAIDFILENFRRWPKILLRKDSLDLFLSIPVDALFLLLESDLIEVDSENSVLLGALLWINAGIKEKNTYPFINNPREVHITEIFKRIRFPQMQKYYLLDFVKHLAYYEFPQHKLDLCRLRDLSLQFHLQPRRFNAIKSQFSHNIFSPRTIKKNEGITITCTYQMPPTTSLTTDNYTPPPPVENNKKKKIHHGYNWECWLDLEAESGQQPSLYCNIRCFMDIVKEHKFYLPVRVELIMTVQAKTMRVGPAVWLYEDFLPKKERLLPCEGMDSITLEARLCLLEDDSDL